MNKILHNHKIPVLSKNLEINPLNGTDHILSNTEKKYYLKINEQTKDILNLIDGKTTIEALCELYNCKYKNTINLKTVENLIYEKLAPYGIIEGQDHLIKPHSKPSYLKLSFIIFREEWVNRISPFFFFLFNKQILYLSLLTILVYTTYFLFKHIDVYSTFSIQKSLIFFLSIKCLSVTFHELGHAVAATFYGAKPGGIGGGFYWFTPVYFTDVTDIWRLRKGERIIVNLSGIYFELILCTIIGGMAYMSGGELLASISVIIAISSLFNLNPFLRSDGYWIITDLTDSPNLMKHSFSKLKNLFRVLKGEKLKWGAKDYIFLLYALACCVAITLLVYNVLILNPNSLLLFPQNLWMFLKALFNPSADVSMLDYANLIIPMIFLVLAYRFAKLLLIKNLNKLKNIFDTYLNILKA